MSNKGMRLILLLMIAGCSSSSDNYPYQGPRCLTTCPKACTTDDECVWANNEICCNFDGVKACAVNRTCPRFCEDKSTCLSTEICCRTQIESDRKECAEPKNCLVACKNDDPCAGNQQICCTVFNTPVCTNPKDCKTACSKNENCDTSFCCKTVKDDDPYEIFSASALCRDPAECPRKCSNDTDCTTAANEKCCRGLCRLATDCNSCTTREDCNNQICCDNKVLDSPWYSIND